MAEVVETLETKLKRHEDALVACMTEITRLREENARLRSSENNAHSVLREIYNDPDAPHGVRVKAAGLALPHETPRLTPVPPAIDATAEEIIPLAELVAQRRAHVDRMQHERLNSPDATPEEKEAIRASISRRNGPGNGGDDRSNND